jgi:hemerythrin superfamily protein
MDAIEILKAEHTGAKALMHDVLAAGGAKRRELFTKLKGELEGHDRIEEEVFYPGVQDEPRSADYGGEDKKAHRSVEDLLASLSTLSVDDQAWTNRFHEMQRQLVDHIAEEETKFFVTIRSRFSTAQLEALGQKMVAAKKGLVKAA